MESFGFFWNAAASVLLCHPVALADNSNFCRICQFSTDGLMLEIFRGQNYWKFLSFFQEFVFV